MIKVVDISALGGVPSGSALRAADVTAILPRVSSGLEPDPTAERAVKQAWPYGIPAVAAYHYLHSGQDGAAQAEVALAALDSLGLPFLFCDVEPLAKPLPTDAPKHYRETVLAFLQRCHDHGRRIGLYGGMFLSLLDLPPEVAELPLWVATYGPTPRVPKPWDTWALWQYQGNVEIGGASVDLSRAVGNLSDLRMRLDCRTSYPPVAWELLKRYSDEEPCWEGKRDEQSG